MADLVLTDNQDCPIASAFLNKSGRPAKVDGVPVWASSDEAIATVTAAPDGLSATISGVAGGECDITVDGDADLGSGVQDVVGIQHVIVTPQFADHVTMTPGTPVDRP